MNFTKIDLRQFLNEIYFLGQEKEFSSSFIEGLKAEVKGKFTFNNTKVVKETLKNKRKSYNYAYVNIFKKYNVPHKDIYEKLDSIWEELLEDTLIENICNLFPLFIEYGNYGKIKRVWSTYKEKSLDLAEKYGEEYYSEKNKN
ncbi:MAG: hypothetical protein ACQEQF_11755 [Bacillota bacterium]